MCQVPHLVVPLLVDPYLMDLQQLLPRFSLLVPRSFLCFDMVSSAFSDDGQTPGRTPSSTATCAWVSQEGTKCHAKASAHAQQVGQAESSPTKLNFTSWIQLNSAPRSLSSIYLRSKSVQFDCFNLQILTQAWCSSFALSWVQLFSQRLGSFGKWTLGRMPPFALPLAHGDSSTFELQASR